MRLLKPQSSTIANGHRLSDIQQTISALMMSASLMKLSMSDLLGFSFTVLCVTVFNLPSTFLFKGGFKCPSLFEALYWRAGIINVANVCNSFNRCSTPAGLCVFAKVARWTRIWHYSAPHRRCGAGVVWGVVWGVARVSFQVTSRAVQVSSGYAPGVVPGDVTWCPDVQVSSGYAPGVGPGVASRVVQVSSGYAPGVVPGTGVVLGVVSSVGVVWGAVLGVVQVSFQVMSRVVQFSSGHPPGVVLGVVLGVVQVLPSCRPRRSRLSSRSTPGVIRVSQACSRVVQVSSRCIVQVSSGYLPNVDPGVVQVSSQMLSRVSMYLIEVFFTWCRPDVVLVLPRLV